jgi:hypothetical protein
MLENYQPLTVDFLTSICISACGPPRDRRGAGIRRTGRESQNTNIKLRDLAGRVVENASRQRR